MRRNDFALSAEQEDFRSALRAHLAASCPLERVRAAEPLGFDAELWKQLGDEMSLSDLGLSEDLGGGASMSDLIVIAEELGRALAPVPFVDHTTAIRLLEATTNGQSSLGMLREQGTTLGFAAEPVEAKKTHLISSGAVADKVIALADGEIAIVGPLDLPPDPLPNLGREPLAHWDLARAPRRVIPSTGDPTALHRRAVMEARILSAARSIGLADAALHLAVEFAQTRVTRGKLIGSLQGVSFPLADSAIAITSARMLTRKAGWYLDHEPEQASYYVAAAYAIASRAAGHAATHAAHVHGGIGFTLEADVSLFFLRAKGWSSLYGDPERELATMARDCPTMATVNPSVNG